MDFGNNLVVEWVAISFKSKFESVTRNVLLINPGVYSFLNIDLRLYFLIKLHM